MVFDDLDARQFIARSPAEGHFGCFWVWQLWVKLSQTPSVQVFVWTYVFSSLGQISLSMRAGLCRKSMFSFVGNPQTILWSGCAILHSHQQQRRVPIAPHILCLYCPRFGLYSLMLVPHVRVHDLSPDYSTSDPDICWCTSWEVVGDGLGTLFPAAYSWGNWLEF